MDDPHCKIGKVTRKDNLVVMENPLNDWSKEAVELAIEQMREARNEDNRVDAITVYMHFSDGTALAHLNRHDSCTIPFDLMGELIKMRVSRLTNRNDAKEVLYEILED